MISSNLTNTVTHDDEYLYLYSGEFQSKRVTKSKLKSFDFSQNTMFNKINFIESVKGESVAVVDRLIVFKFPCKEDFDNAAALVMSLYPEKYNDRSTTK